MFSLLRPANGSVHKRRQPIFGLAIPILFLFVRKLKVHPPGLSLVMLRSEPVSYS